MGLDMYLTASRQLSNWDHEDEATKKLYKKVAKLMDFPVKLGEESPSGTVTFTAVYWRKDNHIHRWFVQNVQAGVDECQKHYVSREQLASLVEACKHVMVNPSETDVLPTQSGFFFGPTAYDEEYFWSLKTTVACLEEALLLGSDWDFYYRSSW